MNSQQLLFINFIILLALVLFFIFGRSKSKQPVKLEFKSIQKRAEPYISDEKIEKERVDDAKDVTPVNSNRLLVKGVAIFFLYNGHEWEAHDILGIPRDSSLQTATSHYQTLIKTSEPSSFEFFEAAYSAILKEKRN